MKEDVTSSAQHLHPMSRCFHAKEWHGCVDAT